MESSRREFLTFATIASAASRLSAAPTPQGPAAFTIKQASDVPRRKSLSPVDLTQACLQRIEQLNPRVNAYVTVTRDQALASAPQAAEEQGQGKWRGPLHGTPIALKDNVDTAGIRTTGASELFKDRIPAEDAEVARRLKNAGAILLGKTNLHEFAHGTTSAVTAFGPVHNPWALDRIPGGYSGGSAAATSADLCLGSIGTARHSATMRNTSPFAVYGLPAISVPCGFTSAGLPVGQQISGAPFAEPTVLALAHAYEQATAWHNQRPML